MPRALVTGSAGFLGRHFTAALTGRGWDVETCDIAEGRDARDRFRHGPETGYDLAVHCAAVVGGRQVIEGDPLAQAENLELDAALFDWARRARPGRVLYLSSSAVYPVDWQDGRHPGYRLREGDVQFGGRRPWLPDRLYGWCKLTGEYLAGLAQAGGLPVTIVRPFSGYGASQSADYPFGAFLARARARENPFTIWGDGQQVRDWIHVDDITGGALALAAQGVPGPVNLGTGRGTSMRELAAMICAEAGYRPRLACQPGRPSGVACRIADPARMLTHYQPAVTLADGIARALKGDQ